MGGKVWSEPEERHFWRVAVAQSPKRAGIDLAKAEKSWDELAKEMQVAIGSLARRQYSGTMLFEHYFQNIESQRRSPNAGIYVREYLAKRNRPRSGVADLDPLSPYSASPAAASDRHQHKIMTRFKRRSDENINTDSLESNSTVTEEAVTDSSSREPSYVDPNNRCFYPTPMVRNSIKVNTGGGPLPTRFYSPEEESLFVESGVCEEDTMVERGGTGQKRYNSG